MEKVGGLELLFEERLKEIMRTRLKLEMQGASYLWSSQTNG